jgi:hypothetical protein
MAIIDTMIELGETITRLADLMQKLHDDYDEATDDDKLRTFRILVAARPSFAAILADVDRIIKPN